MIKRFAMLATLIALMAFMGIGTTFAQGNAVTNYTFTSEAEWLDESYMATVRGNQGVNVRSIPTTKGNDPLFSLPAGATVEVVATVVGESNEDWALVRAWTTNGYEGHGYLNLRVANLNTVATLDAPQPTGCTLTDKGVQVNVAVRFNTGWVHDTRDNNCARFYEGRIVETEIHNYWVVRDNDGSGESVTVENTTYTADTFGFMWLLEGTGWDHPRTWNVGRGFATGDTTQDEEYPAMIAYFAMDKTQVMRDNDYAWPVQVHLIDGTMIEYPFGAFGDDGEINNVNRCEYDEPETMEVTGIYVSATRAFRSTSVGALGCTTVILWQAPEGGYELISFEGARERLDYRYIYTAVLIPGDWDEADLVEYVMDTVIPGARLPRGAEVTNDGLSGLPATFEVE